MDGDSYQTTNLNDSLIPIGKEIEIEVPKPKGRLNLSISTDQEEEDADLALQRALDYSYHRDMERTYTGATPEELGLLDPQRIRTIFKIPVKEGVTYGNIIAIPMVPFCCTLLFTYLNAQVIFLLDNPNMFNVPRENMGKVSGLLVFASLPGAIIGTMFIGYIYDIVGRRLTLFSSFFIGSGLIALVPWTSPSVVPWLLVVRCAIQLTFCAPVSSPLPADYIHAGHIGKGVSMNAIGIVLGEVVSMGVLFRVTENMPPWLSFATCGAIGLFFSIFFLFMVKEPVIREGEKRVPRALPLLSPYTPSSKAIDQAYETPMRLVTPTGEVLSGQQFA